MKRAAVLYTEHTPLIDAIKARISNINCFNSIDNDFSTYELIIDAGFEGIIPFNVLKSHLSLLPAFDTEEPVKQAVIAGAKVTGITIYYTNPQRIIAQYPIFIRNDSHYDEIKQELTYLEQTLFPLVIEKIINNKPFETRDLIKAKNQVSCGGCGKCGHC